MDKNIKIIVDAIEEKFGMDTCVIDIDKVSSVANYYVITTGKTPTQVHAISEEVQFKMDIGKVKLLHSEGRDRNNWVLLDYGNIVVHVFNKDEREQYKLEELWSKGEVLDLGKI